MFKKIYDTLTLHPIHCGDLIRITINDACESLVYEGALIKVDYSRYGDHELHIQQLCHPDGRLTAFRLSVMSSLELIEPRLKENTEDPVNHPSHYKTKSGLETIDVIKAFTENLVGIEAVDTGNILKYICRWKKKNGLQDLKKAKWYLEDLIKHVEEKETNNNVE